MGFQGLCVNPDRFMLVSTEQKFSDMKSHSGEGILRVSFQDSRDYCGDFWGYVI